MNNENYLSNYERMRLNIDFRAIIYRQWTPYEAYTILHKTKKALWKEGLL